MKKSENMLKHMLAKFLAVALVLSLVGAASPAVTAGAAVKPVISQTKAVILVGKKLDLNVKNPVKGATYTWKTSSKKIAAVDGNGVVTGIAKGSATITCTVKTGKAAYKLTSSITVKKPATSLAVTNKVSALNVGQTYNLKTAMKPASANDVISWTSSNSKVLKVSGSGKLTAVKTGKATVTAKTLSGKTAKVSVLVVDKGGTVATQAELNSLLGSGAGHITLKSEAAAEFTIAKGSYKDQELVVDTPNADVANYGTFKNIQIKAIKASTWTEGAVGNNLVILAAGARIVVAEGASASIVIENSNGNINLVVNGTVSSLDVEAAGTITISGTSTAAIPIVNNASGITLTSSLPLNLVANVPMTLVLQAGAESTQITAASEAAVPSIVGNVKISVTIGTGSNAAVKEVTGNGYTGNTTGTTGGSGGGSSGGGSSSVTVDVKGTNGTYTLPVAYTSLKTVVVHYGSLALTVDGTILSALTKFLSSSDTSYDKWVATTNTEKTYASQKIVVTGTAGDNTKTVTFDGGELGSRSYKVTVSESGLVTVQRVGSSIQYGISKTDTKVLTISNAPSDLYFTVTY